MLNLISILVARNTKRSSTCPRACSLVFIQRKKSKLLYFSRSALWLYVSLETHPNADVQRKIIFICLFPCWIRSWFLFIIVTRTVFRLSFVCSCTCVTIKQKKFSKLENDFHFNWKKTWRLIENWTRSVS